MSQGWFLPEALREEADRSGLSWLLVATGGTSTPWLICFPLLTAFPSFSPPLASLIKMPVIRVRPHPNSG